MEISHPVLGSNGYPLQDGAVYGPIHSRRFGNSLGINPLPVTYKFCDFDCVYCQYGWTPRPLNPTDSRTAESSTRSGMRAPRSENNIKKTNEKLKPLSILLGEIETSFAKFKREETSIHVITIAGNGEPTLYPDFLNLTKGILNLRDRYFPNVKVGILSDSSQAHRPEIKAALQMLDERCMKLDAGDSETIEKINKPAGGFDLKRTMEALRNLDDITVQSMFIQGSYDNTHSKQIDAWIEAVQFVKPSSVQVYTIDRPPADSGIKTVPLTRLNEIASMCQKRTGISTEVFD